MASEHDADAVENKLCKDCRWALQPRWWWNKRCTHSIAKGYGSSAFYLYGDLYFLPKCEDIRHPFAVCGHEGKLWEPK